MFELKWRGAIDGFDYLNTTVVVKFIFTYTDHMVATDIRCNGGEIVGKSLSNLLLIFDNPIFMFVFQGIFD